MKFILITGPQAVGKMTVGQELVKITNLKLLHNHMTIELLTKIFDYSRDTFRKLNEEFRVQIFEEFAKSNEEGMIFTTTWNFDSKEDWNMMYRFINIFFVCLVILVFENFSLAFFIYIYGYFSCSV